MVCQMIEKRYMPTIKLNRGGAEPLHLQLSRGSSKTFSEAARCRDALLFRNGNWRNR